jgi:hypothetical protein
MLLHGCVEGGKWFGHGLLDHLIRPLEERRRDRQAESLGGLEVDHQLELRGLFNGQVAGPRTLQYFVDILGSASIVAGEIWRVGHQQAVMRQSTEGTDGRHTVTCRELSNLYEFCRANV